MPIKGLKPLENLEEKVAFMRQQSEIAKKEREERKKNLLEASSKKQEPAVKAFGVFKEKKEDEQPKIIKIVEAPPVIEKNKKEKKEEPTPKLPKVKKKYGPYPRDYYRESITYLMRTHKMSKTQAIQYKKEKEERVYLRKNPPPKPIKVSIEDKKGVVHNFYQVNDVIQYLSKLYKIRLSHAKTIYYKYYSKISVSIKK